jgi:hypothetical protein
MRLPEARLKIDLSLEAYDKLLLEGGVKVSPNKCWCFS